MVLYRLAYLRDLQLQLSSERTQISRYIIAEMLDDKKQIACSKICMCKYSQSSVTDEDRVVPPKFGNESLNNIAKLMKEKSRADQMLFQSTVQEPEKKQESNIHVLLHKLSTFKKIGAYTALALLLFIAAALFLHLEYAFAYPLGVVFFVSALIVMAFAVSMLCCNLYYKKYPQRLVKTW